MKDRRIMIAGTESGVGKTTLTLGIMAALKARGLSVQGFKCGPDYIDPTFHTAVTGRPSRNVDSWMLEPDVLKEIYIHGSAGADISIIEGVMGFYDGYDSTNNLGSTAHISSILECPVVLVINAQAMARSAAAIVKGFQYFSAEDHIVGVIVNRVGGEGHYHLLKQAIEQECQVPVIGYLPNDTNLLMPERHLGLIPALERGELEPLFRELGKNIEATINLNMLIACSESPPIHVGSGQLISNIPGHAYVTEKVTIAVAKDSAFHFYYPESLDLLQAYGAELVEFSPLRNEELPEGAAGLYLGGGFPEEFAEKLSMCNNSKTSIRKAIEAGMPTIAECGGFMFLTEEIVTTDSKTFPMVGIIPGSVHMQSRLAAIGYREIMAEQGNYLLQGGLTAKGHEFHYSIYRPPMEQDRQMPPAYRTKSLYAEQAEGIQYKNMIAGYTHIHFASCPQMVKNWLDTCKEWKNHVKSTTDNDSRNNI